MLRLIARVLLGDLRTRAPELFDGRLAAEQVALALSEHTLQR